MTLEMLAGIAKDALWTSWVVSYPVLLSGLIIGLLISIFQAVTQIHEMTLTFIPKILVAVLTVALMYDKMIQTMISFTTRMFTDWGGFLQ